MHEDSDENYSEDFELYALAHNNVYEFIDRYGADEDKAHAYEYTHVKLYETKNEYSVPFKETEFTIDGIRIIADVPDFSSFSVAETEDSPPMLRYDSQHMQKKWVLENIKNGIELDPGRYTGMEPYVRESIINGSMPKGYALHHDGNRFQIVPEKIHRSVKHVGSRSMTGQDRSGLRKHKKG